MEHRSAWFPFLVLAPLTVLPGCHTRVPATIQVVDGHSVLPLAGTEVQYSFPHVFELFAPKGDNVITDADGKVRVGLATRSTRISVTRPNYGRIAFGLNWSGDHFVLHDPWGESESVADIDTQSNPVQIRVYLSRKPVPDTVVSLPGSFKDLLLVYREAAAADPTSWERVRFARKHNDRVFAAPPSSEVVLMDAAMRPINATLVQQWDTEELWVVGANDRAFEVRMLLTKRTPTNEYLFDHPRYLKVRSELLSGSSGRDALETNPNPRRP